MTIFLADTPANIESGQVAGGERAHRHPEIGKSLIHGFDACTFFDEELSFAAVRAKHAIANKTPAVANQHTDFAERF